MEDVELSVEDARLAAGLESAINHIKKAVSNILSTDDLECEKDNGCLEQVRALVLQIKMSEWGLFGIGEVSLIQAQCRRYSDRNSANICPTEKIPNRKLQKYQR